MSFLHGKMSRKNNVLFCGHCGDHQAKIVIENEPLAVTLNF
jgi:hypothetical protein